MTDDSKPSVQLHPKGMEVKAESWSLPVAISKQYAPLGTFIETGTYEGGGVQQALDAGFQRVYSVENHRGRFARCRDRFEADARVKLYHGLSQLWLPEMLLSAPQPACIFLDAHNNPKEEYPLLVELGFLRLAHRTGDVLVIDDMDIVYGKRDWTKEQPRPHAVHKLIREIDPGFQIRIIDNKHGRPCSILIAEAPR